MPKLSCLFLCAATAVASGGAAVYASDDERAATILMYDSRACVAREANLEAGDMGEEMTLEDLQGTAKGQLVSTFISYSSDVEFDLRAMQRSLSEGSGPLSRAEIEGHSRAMFKWEMFDESVRSISALNPHVKHIYKKCGMPAP